MPDVDKKARRKLIIACVLSLSFMIAEVFGGVFAHSLAIVSDAAHLLTDLASFMISLLAVYLASRRATKKLSFGWYRAEILGALMSILFLWVVTGVLCYMAVERVIKQDFEVNATIIMGVTLHHGGHGHSHGGQSNHTDEEKVRLTRESDNIQDDARGRSTSYGVETSGPNLHVCVFSDCSGHHLDHYEGYPSCAYGSLKDIKEVCDIHDLRIWSLSMDKVALSVHIAVDRKTDPFAILQQASYMIRSQFGISETTIQVEEYVPNMLDCTHCKDLPD
ncbi:ZNT2-like protein [Mya arenaria]|uniref:ZNT2-like protein n=1 Tax=Mya arenaria TaxID=6604 RepID=A0ABY7FDV2_MYAAR|nr:ZNT2-like protein [Mya arenaria]